MTKATRRAAGFLLYRDEPNERLWLLLRNSLHGTWGFPKGHLEKGESDEVGARRELEEETGLTEITIIPGYAYKQAYQVQHPRRGPYQKEVVYFLARLDAGELVRSDEHDADLWVDVDEATQTLQWDELQQALRDAHDLLESAAGEIS